MYKLSSSYSYRFSNVLCCTDLPELQITRVFCHCLTQLYKDREGERTFGFVRRASIREECVLWQLKTLMDSGRFTSTCLTPTANLFGLNLWWVHSCKWVVYEKETFQERTDRWTADRKRQKELTKTRETHGE